jgi:hypothetical protein
MSRVIRANPGEVTLVAIGPLTDVARLFEEDHQAASRLAGLVLMGGMIEPQGTFNRRTREWNMKLDPEAAGIVFGPKGSAIALHRSVIADVTAKVVMKKREFKHWLETGTAQIHALLIDLVAIWFTRHDTVTFHDPLAATTIFDDQICRFERGHMEVVRKPRGQAGKTNWQPDPSGPHEIAREVDPRRFFDHLSRILGLHYRTDTVHRDTRPKAASEEHIGGDEPSRGFEPAIEKEVLRSSGGDFVTVGYGGRSPEELVGLLRHAGVAVVVDVRLRPDSAAMGAFTRAKTDDKGIRKLLRTAGIDYRSHLELGNMFVELDDWRPRYRRLLDAAADVLIERLADIPRPFALLCAERDVIDCHRCDLAEQLVARGFRLGAHL